LANTGSATLKISSIKASSTFSETSTCAATLAVGASCVISVEFTPNRNGAITGTVTVVDNAAGSPQTVALAGTGTVASLIPASLNFGNQSIVISSPAQAVTLANLGASSLHVTGITFSGTNPGDFSEKNNCTTIAAGSSCTINVVFSPAVTGARSGLLNVNFSSGGVSPLPASLAGVGVSLPPVILSPLSANFGSQPLHSSSAAQAVTLTNNARAALSISSIAIGGTNRNDFLETNTCGASLSGGASCTISVRFQPTAPGSRSGSVLITDNSSGSPQSVALSGLAPAPVPYLQGPLVPVTVTPGAAGSALTLNGTGFVPGSSVLFNGSARTTTFVSQSQLQAALLSADLATPGTAQMVVTSPTPGGGISNPQALQITNPTSTVATGANIIAVGTDPRGVAVANFAGDAAVGVPDIAVLNRASDSVSILMGNGDGTFAAPASFATGVDPIAIAVGDLNGDGIPDLVTANRASYTISVLLGNGDGTFQTHVDYAAGTEPVAIVVADFNGDGYLDVAEANSADNTISVYLGVGNGTLQSPAVYSVGSDPIALVEGDFNGDGILDLAAADSGSNNVAILYGSGNGIFQNAVYYATGTNPDGLFTADLNGDGKLDLVAANSGSNNLSVLLNSGNGSFASGVPYAAGVLPFGIVGGDFYGNGIIDVAVVNNGGNSVSLLPGNGDGTFNAAGALTYSTGNAPISIAVGDFNLDGRADLLVSNSQDNTISVMLQVPVASLSTPSLAFGTLSAGGSAAQNVVLSNTGSAALSIGSIAITGGAASQYSQTNTCAATLAAGNNCTITATFAPNTAGTMQANLTVTDSAGGGPQSVSLLGTAVAPAVVLTPASLTFAPQIVNTTSPAQVIALTNSGSAPLTLTSITASSGYGESNTCGTSVAAGATCNISVTFTPGVTGSQSGSITLIDNAGGSQTISLTGSGVYAPAVTLSPASLVFPSQAIDTTSAAQTITVTNTGLGPLTVSGIATTGSYSQTNTCAGPVAPAASCTISVFFTPTATGSAPGNVQVNDNAGNSPQSVTLTGTGAKDPVGLSPTSLSFGNQPVNSSSSVQVIKLTNNTGGKLTIKNIAASANFSQTNNCGTGGAAGGTCTINVTFTPTTFGNVTGTLTLTDSYSTSPQTLPLTGVGVVAGAGFSPASLTFADQAVGTSSAMQAVTMTNIGSAALAITSVSVAGTNGGDFSETTNCGTSLAVAASCTINVAFAPTASGARSASITVADSALGSPQGFPISGTGIAPAVGLSPASVTFASQAVGTTSAAAVVTLSNSGSAALTIGGVSITGSNSGDFSQSNSCGASLAPATSCAIDVTFTPLAAGTRQATLSISDNATGTPQTIALTGTGAVPAVSFSAATLTFANQPVGSPSPANGVTLFNTGSAPLSISSINITGANAGDFSQTNNCGASVAAGSNCTISATFTPTAPGTRSAALSFVSNATGSPQSVALSGFATSGGPTASVSPLTLKFASQNLVTTSAPQSVTLTNTGGAALSITSIVASGDYAQTNNCGSSLAAAASCTINVTFSPSFTGSRTGYITFADSDPSILQTVSLTGTGAAPSTTVAINPMQASVTPGQSTQLQASISGVASSSVTWSVDGISGGNSTVGTISPGGLYTAPSTAGSHTVTATSIANTTQSASIPVVVTAFAGTFVYHNDNGRTGQNLNETVLTTGNVNSQQFGKLFSCPVDGQIYGQPLYAMGVNFPGNNTVPAGTYNVVYVATENDSVYAFDADGSSCTPLWQVSFLTNGAQVLNTTDIGGCSNITPAVGITGTPVIDPLTGTMFVVARTKQGSAGNYSYYQNLYALNIASGQVNQSTLIQASVSASSGTDTFNPITQNQRAGLFLSNGVVYIAWAAHCDIQPYHGWLMGYQESNLQQVAVFNATPNGVEGGIWQSGAAPAVDEYGYIYLMVGNGTFDVNAGGVDYGEGLVKLSPSGNALNVADYFVPSNYQTLNASDLDLGSGGPLLIPAQGTPPTQLLVAAGKQGMVYLINQTDLGEFDATSNNVLQTLPAGTVPTAHSMPAYWQNNIYFAGVGVPLSSYLLSNGLLSTSPTSHSPDNYGYPGATPAVSANGAGNGMVWALSTVLGIPAVLRVYDAANVSRELYTSNQIASRDQAGMAVKFAVPTVANGKVYVGTQTELDVYGLLPQP
jgi:hypothetical protein